MPLQLPTEFGSVDLDYDPAIYQTCETAAKALHQALRKIARGWGLNPDIEMFIKSPKDNADMGYGDCWRVCWECGPYEWAVRISFEITGPWGYVEPYHSFDLCFVEN